MSPTIPRQHVILCEGYDDRSFWRGCLLHLGCTDPSTGGRTPIRDVWEREVRRGQYLFKTPSGSGVLVQPCHGRDAVLKASKFHFNEATHRPGWLLLNLDSDLEGGSGPDHRAAIRQLVVSCGGQANEGSSERFLLHGIQVATVIWECPEQPTVSGVPARQTLERLIAAAICAAYPERGLAVERWLRDEPRSEKLIPKNYGYSYLAKWYAEHGADDFFSALWRDENIAQQLRELLAATGAWATINDLVND